jgi:lipopolysaccharide/colanic/teichoic acid biosynthesis glycosyltransferase
VLLKEWEELPEFMRNDAVRPYYDALKKRPFSLIIKRLFDIAGAVILLLILWPVMLVIAILIRCESKGPAIFKQERVTSYGCRFRILKFRTMVDNAEKIGPQVTVSRDYRITRFGWALRNSRLDELPQLINILIGEMSFVGTRPEVVRYVERYTDEMKATLLLPAGVTSEASIMNKDEYRLLSTAKNVDDTYVNKVLPAKMQYNYCAMLNFSIMSELRTLIRTMLAVFGMLNIVQGDGNAYKSEKVASNALRDTHS